MAEKIKIVYKGRIKDDTALVTNGMDKSTWVSKILLRELDNTSTVRLTVDNEPISDPITLEFGQTKELDTNLFIAPGEVLRIQVDNVYDENFNTNIINALKEKLKDLKLGEINVVFIKYGVICFKAKKLYHFYDYNFDKLLTGTKVEILADLGRTSYFFKVDNVVYCIIENKLVDIATYSNIQFICKDRFVLYDDKNAVITIYNSTAKKTQERYNGKILAYSEDYNFMIIRTSPYEKDAIPKKPDANASKECICWHYNLLTGEKHKIIALEDIEGTVQSDGYDHGWRWTSLTCNIIGNKVVLTAVTRANGSYAGPYYGLYLRAVVYDAGTRQLVKRFEPIVNGNVFYDKEWILLKSINANPNESLCREYIYNVVTGEYKEFNSSSITQRPWTVFVLNKKVYLFHTNNNKVAVLPSIEAYFNMQFDQLQWTYHTIYSSTSYRNPMITFMSNDWVVMRADSSASSKGFVYTKTEAIGLNTTEAHEDIKGIHGPIENTSYNPGMFYNGQLYISLSTADTYNGYLYIRNGDLEVQARNTKQEDNDYVNKSFFFPAAITSQYSRTHNPVDMGNTTGKPYNPITPGNTESYSEYPTSRSLGTVMFTNDYNTTNLTALIIRVNGLYARPGILQVSYDPGVQNNPSKALYFNIPEIDYIYGLEGDATDGYVMYTNAGKYRFKIPDSSKFPNLTQDAVNAWFGKNTDPKKVDPNNFTAIDESVTSPVQGDADKLYVRVTGIEIDE